MKGLSQQEAASLLYDWDVWARPNQLPPAGDWLVWLLMAGRGFGKTRTGAEFLRHEVDNGNARHIALVGMTPADVRDVMLEGESGLLNISPPWNKPLYEPSKRKVTWPNGAVAITYSGYEPDQLNGPQHDFAWCDELRTWKYPQETWDMLMLGLRLGLHPRCVVTTTPSPIKLIKNLIASKNTVVTRGSTYDNRCNLADSFFSQILTRYEGTRLGRQEINAELLEDTPGALWKSCNILIKQPPSDKDGKLLMRRIVVAIDPAATSVEGSDETGIMVAGLATDGFYYVLADRSGRYTPDGWANMAINAYRAFSADRIIWESNMGGEMVAAVLKTADATVPTKGVHASHGKQARAEPIAALYEQHKVFHVKAFDALDDQLTTWTPESKDSPDRLDALVWALTELSGGAHFIGFNESYERPVYEEVAS